jgi:hypothetical protein
LFVRGSAAGAHIGYGPLWGQFAKKGKKRMTTENDSDGSESISEQGAKVRTFKIQIDKPFYEIQNPTPTGRELLQLAGKVPPEQFAIYLKGKGSQPQRIELNEKVDLREPGVERFVTLPLDQTEG